MRSLDVSDKKLAGASIVTEADGTIFYTTGLRRASMSALFAGLASGSAQLQVQTCDYPPPNLDNFNDFEKWITAMGITLPWTTVVTADVLAAGVVSVPEFEIGATWLRVIIVPNSPAPAGGSTATYVNVHLHSWE